MTEKRATQNNSLLEDDDISDEEGGFRVDDIYIPPPAEPYCSVECKGPRLIITKIMNHWFKSYANTIQLGPFHKSFNAIIGPNGSGKSNVIDSMLFVFGYRANKIRSKKLSSLIHNSTQFTNVQSATVAVHFAQIVDVDYDRYNVVPDTEFCVSRTINKDNSSFYCINDRRVHFREVAALLKQHGIDLKHNRFLILQGEVEQIAMMNPKGGESETGMLEYLEEIIGTTRYKQPLEKLYSRYDKLTDERSEKINRLKLIENELDELKTPLNEAIEFLQLENSIIVKKNFYYQMRIISLQGESSEHSEGLAEAEAEVKEAEKKLSKLESERTKTRETLDEMHKKFEAWQASQKKIDTALDKANIRDVELKTEMTHLVNDRKKRKAALIDEHAKLEKLRNLPETTNKDLAECDSAEEKLIVKKQKLEEQKVQLQASIAERTRGLQERKDVVQTKLTELLIDVNGKKSEYSIAESNLKMCTHDYDKEKKKLDELVTSYQNSQSQIDQRSSELEKLRKLLPEKDDTLQKATVEVQTLKTQLATVGNDIHRKRNQLNEIKSAMHASRSRNTVLNALQDQKMKGNCPGLFGRLGDLGAIDAKYDVAVSTACGPLDNIVVDTVETGKWCIDYLKRHDIGRTTIIALDKVEHLRQHCEHRLKTPENVPRLYDLIQIPDDRVKTAFYYGLRNTLVANDLEQASRIAYGSQRYRVVTLKGDLIELSGTMSGGGNTVLRGRMGQSVKVVDHDPKQIETLEVSLQENEVNFQNMKQREVALDTQIASLTPEVRQMKIAVEKYNMELKTLNSQQPFLKKQIDAQEVKVKGMHVDQAELKRLQKDVDAKKSAFEKVDVKAQELQKQVDEINHEIDQGTKGEKAKVEKALKEVVKGIEKLRTEKTRLNVALKSSDRNAAKTEEKIASIEEFIKNAEEKLHALKAERDNLFQDADELAKESEKINRVIEAENENLTEVKSYMEQLTKKENNLKSKKIEIDEKYNALKEKVDVIVSQVKQWEAKLKELKLNEIPDQTVTPLKTYTEEELKANDMKTLSSELKTHEEQLSAMKPNLNIIKEYHNKKEIYVSRTRDLNAVTEKRNEIRGHYDTLVTRRKDEFLRSYNIIKMKLKEMYQMITLGGDADFELVDHFDPFSEGIQFRVRPPKKTWKNISNLSGGEKTLSSLALVFALHYYKPSPLYVMDEIDAALDFKNVSIIGNYIKERTQNAQFIIISLRSNMFELTNYLVGIYKVFNCTHSITINAQAMADEENIEERNENNEERNENIEERNENNDNEVVQDVEMMAPIA